MEETPKPTAEQMAAYLNCEDLKTRTGCTEQLIEKCRTARRNAVLRAVAQLEERWYPDEEM